MTSREPHRGNRKKGDVVAWVRDGVKCFMLIDGLPEAVACLSACSTRDLVTRAGLAAALAKIGQHHPAPNDTRLRLRISTATPPEASTVLTQVRRVLEANPSISILRDRWPGRTSKMFDGPLYEVSGADSVLSDARQAWDVVASIAVASQIQMRSIETPGALGLAAARALRKLRGREEQAEASVAALPRA